jgi:hypothetical protein
VRRYREKRRRRANKPKWFCHLSEHSLGCSSYIILYSVGAAAFDWSCTTLLCPPQYSQPSSCIIIYISSFVSIFFLFTGSLRCCRMVITYYYYYFIRIISTRRACISLSVSLGYFFHVYTLLREATTTFNDEG